eukprot:Tbor_TRINITY_DN5879_c1_g6::TRINITY_DN5879_c1_g6_i1::g.7110::m.7110
MMNCSNSVRLVTNPTKNLSIHEWIPRNVKSMNRSNKMSSAPFYIPNDTMKQHLFRIVLLRGIEHGDTVNDDPLAIYVEYMPRNGDVVQNEIEEVDKKHPESCRVGIWVLCNDPNYESAFSHLSHDADTQEIAAPCADIPKGPPHIYDEDFHVFNENSRMMGFKKIVPANKLFDDRFVDPLAYNAMIIRVEIQTCVTSVVDRVATATDRLMGSFWGSAASAFGLIHTGIDIVQTQIVNFSKERSEHIADDNDVMKASFHKNLPWDVLPPNWKKTPLLSMSPRKFYDASKSEDEKKFYMRSQGQNDIYEKTAKDENSHESEPSRAATEEEKLKIWRDLIMCHIPEDDGTFLYGPSRGLHPDEQVLLTQVGLNHKNIMNAATLFDYDRDIHEGLLDPPKIRIQRYKLVPKLISDEIFWSNYMWKVASLTHCCTNEQVQLLLSILNAPPLHMKYSSQPSDRHASDTIKADNIYSSTVSVISCKDFCGERLESILKEALEASEVLEELLEGIDESHIEMVENTNISQCEIERTLNVAADSSDLNSDQLLMMSAGASCVKYLDMLNNVLKDQSNDEITEAIRLTHERLQKLVRIAYGVVAERKVMLTTSYDEVRNISPKSEDTVGIPQVDRGSNEEGKSVEKNDKENKEQDVRSLMGEEEAMESDIKDATAIYQKGCSAENLEKTTSSSCEAVERNYNVADAQFDLDVRAHDEISVVGEVVESRDGSQSFGTHSSRKIKFDPMPWDEDP